jgi:hypothetical protein
VLLHRFHRLALAGLAAAAALVPATSAEAVPPGLPSHGPSGGSHASNHHPSGTHTGTHSRPRPRPAREYNPADVPANYPEGMDPDSTSGRFYATFVRGMRDRGILSRETASREEFLERLPWLDEVNPESLKQSRDPNCNSCAVAVANRFAGIPDVAEPMTPQLRQGFWRRFALHFDQTLDLNSVVDEIDQAQVGAQAIAHVNWRDAQGRIRGHAFNILKTAPDEVAVVDGQRATGAWTVTWPSKAVIHYARVDTGVPPRPQH